MPTIICQCGHVAEISAGDWGSLEHNTLRCLRCGERIVRKEVSRQNRRVWAVPLLLLLLLGLGIGGAWAFGLFGSGARQSVRNHLRNTLPSGRWEEVEWFAPVEASGCRLWDRTETRPGHAIRLRYRTQNAFGATMLVDQTFFVGRDGKVFDAVPSDEVMLPGESATEMRQRLEQTRDAAL